MINENLSVLSLENRVDVAIIFYKSLFYLTLFFYYSFSSLVNCGRLRIYEKFQDIKTHKMHQCIKIYEIFKIQYAMLQILIIFNDE